MAMHARGWNSRPPKMQLTHRLDGPPGRPVLVLVHPLGLSGAVWQPQLDAFAATNRVVRVDLRGHGGSPCPPGPYDVPLLAADVLELLDALAIERARFCGLSIGGAVSLWLAASAPERVERLVVACSSARFGEPAAWHERAARVRAGGMEAVADFAVGRWFTPAFAQREPQRHAHWRAQFTAAPPEGYAACCEALAAWDFRDRLGEVRAPTLVIAGADDPASPLPDVHALRDGIPGAQLAVLPGAAHLASVEQPEQFTALAAAHLK
jgi:3-oxoadipate enol-lactonase